MALTNADYQDMQGLLRYGYSRLSEACFLLLRINDPVAAGRWLETAPVTTAEERNPPPEQALQVAFTHEGIRKLGLPGDQLDGFSMEFITGMCGDENRSRRLGDVGENSPEYWEWGGPTSGPDMVALIYARPGMLSDWQGTIEGSLQESGFSLLRCLSTSDMGGVEPFGFVDGVSEPKLDWGERRTVTEDKLSYENVTMLGEFVLGYPNEYGRFTERPTIASQAPGSLADLPIAQDAERCKDLGRNGTYLVIRQIEQDVRGFWQFIDAQAKGDASKGQILAEKMVGRRMSGDSLVPVGSEKIAGVGPDPIEIQRNQFTFDEDANGTGCPFGAHVRRANPRTADYPAGTRGIVSKLIRLLGFQKKTMREDIVASTRFHRLIRRGREYGPKLLPIERLKPRPSTEAPSGLHFVCLNANIARQFEFVQSAWLMNGNFGGLSEESDPLLGNRGVVAGRSIDRFSFPVEGSIRTQIRALPRFTTVRGGAYFFLPGLRALRYIARTARD